MGLFSRPQQEQKCTCDERITKLESEIRKLKTETLDLTTSLDSIRNKVLRKIQVSNDEEKELTVKVLKPGAQYYG